MGMGMPGWCDYQRGVLYQLTNVRVWDREIPVKEMMEQALGLPVVLDNDANCMAYAEWKMGAGRGMSSLVCLTMGTGIGGGIVVHDRMLRRLNGMPGRESSRRWMNARPGIWTRLPGPDVL